MTLRAPQIPDDQQIPPAVLDQAARMAKSGRHKAPYIAEATRLSEQPVVRMLISGSLTYTAKSPRSPAKKWRRR